VNDKIDPPHYRSTRGGVEAIEITSTFSFTLGNVVKYVWRADSKNGLEDLIKARWYLDFEIKHRQQQVVAPHDKKEFED